MKNLKHFIFLIVTLFTKAVKTNAQQQKSNILYILTDDQRYDSVKTFNQEIDGREMSELGYLESLSKIYKLVLK